MMPIHHENGETKKIPSTTNVFFLQNQITMQLFKLIFFFSKSDNDKSL
jgi:hypothetical protein